MRHLEHGQTSRRGRRGFTLVEVLAAIAVTGVAATIIISLFNHSLTITAKNRSVKVAASLAQDRLLDLVQNPSGYYWGGLAGLEPGTQQQIPLISTSPESEPELRSHIFSDSKPGTIPYDKAGSKREVNFYDKFRWRAYAEAPTLDASYITVTVAVSWIQNGKDELFALTSALARDAMETANDA